MSLASYVENIATMIIASCLSAFVVWWTGSLWGLLGLLLLLNMNYPRTKG